MVQIKGTEEIQDDGKGQLAFKSFLKYFWTIALLITSFIGFTSGFVLGGVLYLVATVVYFLFVNNIVWNISNTVRKWIMPEAYVSTDAMDAFKQKMFWNIGPQWFGSLIGWLILTGLVEVISPVIYADDKPRQSVSESTAPVNVAQTKQSFVVPSDYRGSWYLDADTYQIRCDSNPLMIDSEKLMQGTGQSPLSADSDGIISDYGDRIKLNSDGTLTAILKDNPNQRLTFKKCDK